MVSEHLFDRACADLLEMRVRAEAAERRCLELSRSNQHAVECSVCSCLFVPGGKSVELVCGTCLRERAEAAERRVKEFEMLPKVSTEAHEEQIAALNKKIDDITARSEAAFSAILRADDVSGALEEERDQLKDEVARLKKRNERMTQYVDDACECCRCCECQGWNPECSILATKRHKGIDIVTGEQLRAAAEGE